MLGLQKGAVCPECEKGRLAEVRKDVKFEYKGKSITFRDQVIFSCDICGFEGLTGEANERIEAKLTDFRRVTDNLLTSDEMKSIRQKLDLNKKEMAELLSVNDKTVGRYESGKVTQSEQVDKLYRIFQNFPSVARHFGGYIKCRSVIGRGQRQKTTYHVSAKVRQSHVIERQQHPSEEWENEYEEAA